MKKFLALVLSLCMVFSLAAVASAAEIDADGGSGSTPVYLSSTCPAPRTAASAAIPHRLPCLSPSPPGCRWQCRRAAM